MQAETRQESPSKKALETGTLKTEAPSAKADPAAKPDVRVVSQNPTPPAEPAKNGKRPFLVLGGVVAVVLAGIGGYMFLTAGHESTDDAQVAADSIPVGARVGGQVLSVAIHENQLVKKGDLVAVIDDRDFVARQKQAEAEVASAKAQANQADAQVSIVTATSTGTLSSAKAAYSGSSVGVASAGAQVAAAQAAIVRAEADQHRAEADLARAKELRAANAVPQERLDNAQSAVNLAKATVEQSKAQLLAAQEGRRAALAHVSEAAGRVAQSAPIDAQIAAAHAAAELAHARVTSAEAAFDLAKLQLSYTKLTAPADGLASKLGVHEGQLVAMGQPIVTIIPTQTYVIANFKETQVGKMRPGQRATIEIDAYPHREFEGKVESLSGGTGSSFSLLPADNASGNFVKVVQRVPVRIAWVNLPADVALRAGLSVDAVVEVGQLSSALARAIRRRAVGVAGVLAACSIATVAGATPERLTIEDVAKLVVTTGPELKAARERAQGVFEQTHVARGHLLPAIHLSDEYQHWDSPFAFPAFGNVRDVNTNTFTASASQPLLGLLSRGHEYSARKTGAAAAEQGVRASEASARESAELEFLNYFLAKTRADVARASEQELAAQVKETQARVNAGALTRADLLRVQVAEATARQDGIVADADATVARATLLVAIGHSPDDANVNFAPPDRLLALGDMPAPSPAEVEARRAEIQQAKLQAEAADHDASARGFALLPEVNLEGGYQHQDGSKFAPPNQAFVGVKADWAIWEWGSKNAEKNVAQAEARAAVLEIDSTRRRVSAEVTGRKAELSAAVSAVALAKQTIVSAEEAYRVTAALVHAGSGTTTDLLNAESALTQARLSLERARYAQAASRIRLERAAGLR